MNDTVKKTQRHTMPLTRRLPGRSLLFAMALVVAAVVPARGQFTGPGVATSRPDRTPMVPSALTDLAGSTPTSIYLEPGDLVSVHLFGATDYAPTVRVNLDSTIQLPLIGILSVKGLNVEQAENLIAARLKSAGMYVDPQVTLNITETPAQIITVSGEAHAVIPITGEHHLLEILAIAGGLPPGASHTIAINRPGLDKPIVIDLGTDPLHSAQANVPVFPGDTIVVSRVGVVYLLGEFKTAGAIPIQQNSPLTLLQAASLSGGPLFAGKFADLRIIRTVNQQRTLVRVNIKDVMLGKAPDPILQADDIVFLPTNLMKAVISSGGANVLVSLASVMLVAAYH